MYPLAAGSHSLASKTTETSALEHFIRAFVCDAESGGQTRGPLRVRELVFADAYEQLTKGLEWGNIGGNSHSYHLGWKIKAYRLPVQNMSVIPSSQVSKDNTSTVG